MHTKTANVHTETVHVTVEAFLGGRDKKTRETPRGERVATKKKTCGALRAPQTCFFFRRDSRSPRGLTRFLSHGPPRTLVGAVHWFAVSLWVCRVSLGLPCLSLFAVSLLVCRVSLGMPCLPTSEKTRPRNQAIATRIRKNKATEPRNSYTNLKNPH